MEKTGTKDEDGQEAGVAETREPAAASPPARKAVPAKLPNEIGGVKGPEPTRYGDWEHKGRCTDF